MPKKKEKYQVAKVDTATLQAAAQQPGVDSIQGLMLPSCLGWLDEKLGKKEKPSKRLKNIAEQLESYAYTTVQYGLSRPDDYDRKVVMCCTSLSKRAHRLGFTAGANSPHDLLGLTNGREKQAILVAIKFATASSPPQLSSSEPPSYSQAVGGAVALELPPGYGAATGLPTFFAMYRSQGKKSRGLTFPHIYLFDPSEGEFKSSVKDAHHMFEALLAFWGGSQEQVSSVSAWTITPDEGSWDAYDDDDSDDEDRYVEWPPQR